MHYAISTKVLGQTHMWYTQHKWSNLKLEGNLFQDHKEVRERTMFAIIVDLEDTLDQIVISLEHWRMQLIKGEEDQEMIRGIELNKCKSPNEKR